MGRNGPRRGVLSWLLFGLGAEILWIWVGLGLASSEAAMLRLGVILGLCLLLAYWGYEPRASSALRSDSGASGKITKREYYKIAKSEVHWILPRIELQTTRICRGELGEDFGYSEGISKTILFLKTAEGAPEIVTARIRNLFDDDRRQRELNSRALADLNFHRLESEGAYAEHGSLKDLADYDRDYGTRRFDNLLEQAAYLCTQGMTSWDQRVIEMEKIHEEVRDLSGSYVVLEWPSESREATMDVYYEVAGRTFKAELALDY